MGQNAAPDQQSERSGAPLPCSGSIGRSQRHERRRRQMLPWSGCNLYLTADAFLLRLPIITLDGDIRLSPIANDDPATGVPDRVDNDVLAAASGNRCGVEQLAMVFKRQVHGYLHGTGNRRRFGGFRRFPLLLFSLFCSSHVFLRFRCEMKSVGRNPTLFIFLRRSAIRPSLNLTERPADCPVRADWVVVDVEQGTRSVIPDGCDRRLTAKGDMRFSNGCVPSIQTFRKFRNVELTFGICESRV